MLLDGNPTERHLYKPLDRVKVFNSNLRGETTLEGVATVITVIDEVDHMYVVEFDNEPGNGYDRFVGPGQEA